MTIIHLSNGQKGGVGKSLMAMLLAEYLTANKTTFKLFDLDSGSHDVGRLYDPKAYKGDEAQPTAEELLLFSDNYRRSDKVDVIFETAVNNDVIVNLPSNVKHLLNPWIVKKGLIQMAAENNILFVNWFVSNGDEISINEFLECLDTFQQSSSFQTVFVKNFSDDVPWDSIFNSNTNLREAIEADNIICVDVPLLSPLYFSKMKEQNLTFSKVDNKNLGLMGHSSIKAFLNKVKMNFDATFAEIDATTKQPAGA